MRFVKGFTLVELLIAVALSAFIATAVYGFFNTIEKAGKFSEENSRLQSFIPPLYYLLLRDVESTDDRYGKLSVLRRSNGEEEVEFFTKNCYFFKGVCLVRYRLYKGYLIREELRLNSLSGKGIEVPVVSGISKMEVFTSLGGDWSKTAGRGRLIKFVFTLKEGGELPFVFRLF